MINVTVAVRKGEGFVDRVEAVRGAGLRIEHVLDLDGLVAGKVREADIARIRGLSGVAAVTVCGADGFPF